MYEKYQFTHKMKETFLYNNTDKILTNKKVTASMLNSKVATAALIELYNTNSRNSK